MSEPAVATSTTTSEQWRGPVLDVLRQMLREYEHSGQVLEIVEKLVARNSELELQVRQLLTRRNPGEGYPFTGGVEGLPGACDGTGMTHCNQVLSEQIERLVREHIEANRLAAAAAVERAFSSASAGPRLKAARAPTRAAGRRRAPAEVAALGERVYEAVCAQPGETMSVLAPELGKTPRELHRPMTLLKRAGRVRSVGQRHQMRYFPAVVRPPASGG